VSQKTRSIFVFTHPIEGLQALVGPKDVQVRHIKRIGSKVELMIEQIIYDILCSGCGTRAQVEERPVVR
jgi:hypothetical protein